MHHHEFTRHNTASLAALLAATALLSACALPAEDDAADGWVDEDVGAASAEIVNGYEGADAEFWGQVLLFHERGHLPVPDDSRCSGTLLRNNVVLTARHCVTEPHGQITGPIDRLYSAYTLRMAGQSVGVTDIIDIRNFPGAAPTTDSVLMITDRFFSVSG